MAQVARSYDLVVLAGGTASRLGGVDKAGLVVGGVRLLDRVLAAGAGAGRRVVVGPVRVTAHSVVWCREDPPGGGPVAGLGAGLGFVEASLVAVLAVDLPLVDQATITTLLAAAAGHDGAMGVDLAGHDQPLLAVFDVAALRSVLAETTPLAGASMRSVLSRLDLARVTIGEAAMDCDSWADVGRAETAVLATPGGPP
jgi:molybdopterin-guanine dinucleotide biosynthesis protein A